MLSPGRGLTGDGDVAVSDNARRFELNQTRNAEDDGARATGFDGGAIAAGDWCASFVVVEIGHFNDAATTTTSSEAAVSFGGWKGEEADAESCQTSPLVGVAICAFGLVYAPGSKVFI